MLGGTTPPTASSVELDFSPTVARNDSATNPVTAPIVDSTTVNLEALIFRQLRLHLGYYFCSIVVATFNPQYPA
jgi:hypothetical protein